LSKYVGIAGLSSLRLCEFWQDMTLPFLKTQGSELQKQFGDKYVTLIVGCALDIRSFKFDTMSVTEVKSIIVHQLDGLSQEQLEQVLDLLQRLKVENAESFNRLRHARDIMEESKVVLQKLAL
jgi:hypothetical protein